MKGAKNDHLATAEKIFEATQQLTFELVSTASEDNAATSGTNAHVLFLA